MCTIKVLQIQGVGVFRYTMWKCDLQTHLYHTCRPKSRSQESPAELNKTNKHHESARTFKQPVTQDSKRIHPSCFRH